MNIKLITLIMICILSTGCASMNSKDYARLSANALTIVDNLQTHEIADNPDDYAESNNIYLDRHPTTGDVNRNMLFSLILLNVIGAFLPEKWDENFYWTVTGVEGGAVFHNYNEGIRIRF